MSCIVYITNKNTNVKYAYRSESYRDPVTKKPKSKRTYLGRVDPVTNEIIPKAPKGKRNRTPVWEEDAKPDERQSKVFLSSDLSELRTQIDFLKAQQDELNKKVADISDLISRLHSLVHKS